MGKKTTKVDFSFSNDDVVIDGIVFYCKQPNTDQQ
jgi:hypothetical protein